MKQTIKNYRAYKVTDQREQILNWARTIMLAKRRSQAKTSLISPAIESMKTWYCDIISVTKVSLEPLLPRTELMKQYRICSLSSELKRVAKSVEVVA